MKTLYEAISPKQYIQTLNNVVNLIGGKAEGLPLPEGYLSQNPQVINLPAEKYNPLPQIGQKYDPETDTFSTPEPPLPQIPPVSNEETVQAVMYLTATLDLLTAQGGQTIAPMSMMLSGEEKTQSERYEFWRFAYLHNHTNVFTLDKLVAGGMLTQEEVDRIVEERKELYGI